MKDDDNVGDGDDDDDDDNMFSFFWHKDCITLHQNHIRF